MKAQRTVTSPVIFDHELDDSEEDCTVASSHVIALAPRLTLKPTVTEQNRDPTFHNRCSILACRYISFSYSSGGTWYP
jgi:hypothetical protein